MGMQLFMPVVSKFMATKIASILALSVTLASERIYWKRRYAD